MSVLCRQQTVREHVYVVQLATCLTACVMVHFYILQLAKAQLELALRSTQRESIMITDSEVADVQYKLGRICWTMGGPDLTNPTQARAHLEAATKGESEVQASVFQLIFVFGVNLLLFAVCA